MPRRYMIYDVFTRQKLAGNPLAVVLDTDGLDTDGMQRIATEFNLSETSFICPAQQAAHTARVRIFTPAFEMPFAGHPTVGSAIALAELKGDRETASLMVLEEEIGPVRCVVTAIDGAAFAEFDLARLPEALEFDADREGIAAALGLAPAEIGFEDHPVGCWSAGVPYVTVPVANLAAMRNVRFDNGAWSALSPPRDNGNPASAYLYCRETIGHESAFHSRMFVPGAPSYEDPATGSAAAALAGAIMASDAPTDGVGEHWIEQGMEMGRPSRIRLTLDVEGGALARARIGGHAVKVAEGMLFV